MATKRRLYQPAPKCILVGDRRTRKPLVQGRLVSDPGTSHTHDPALAHGQSSVPGDLHDDPTMQPAKSLPVLTENVSSRPEPLHCLDLSDTEADLSYTDRPQSVMVFDASAMGDSSAGAEVDVVMAYEQSPARIICHTPGKLQRSLCYERTANISALCGGDGPGISVRVDKVQNVAGYLPRNDPHCQNVLDDKENLIRLEAAKNKSYETAGHYSSHHNRGIIEEILMQELGSSNVEAISLHSEMSPLSGQQLTAGALSAQPQRQVDNREGLACLSVNDSQTGDSSLASSVCPRSSHMKQKKHCMNVSTKASAFPQPRFDDSDTSIDQVPVKDSIQNQQAKLHDDHSGSETCSLYEYVTADQPHNQPVGFNKLHSSGKPLPDGEQTLASASTKKRKLRKVTSRYLQSSVSKTAPQNKLASRSSSLEASVLKSNSRPPAAGSAAGRQTREKQHVDMRAELRSRKTASGKSTRANSNLVTKPANLQTQQSVVVTSSQPAGQSDSPQEATRSSRQFPNAEQKTSTPTHDQTCHLSSQDIDASAIHSVSAVSINTSMPGIHPSALANRTSTEACAKHLLTQPTSNKRTANRANTDHSSSTSDTSQLQLDLEHTRYLQWAFLNSKVSHMLQEQEKHSAAHVHALWKIVESSREANARLRMDVARLEQINLLDSILDKTEPDLNTVVSLLPQLEEYYCRLSSALDTTRHQLPTRNIHSPQASAAQQDEYEDNLEAALAESEQLLTELDEVTGDKVLPLGQYLDCIETIQKHVLSTFSELHDSQLDVTALKGLSTRLSSLSVQEMQL